MQACGPSTLEGHVAYHMPPVEKGGCRARSGAQGSQGVLHLRVPAPSGAPAARREGDLLPGLPGHAQQGVPGPVACLAAGSALGAGDGRGGAGDKPFMKAEQGLNLSSGVAPRAGGCASRRGGALAGHPSCKHNWQPRAGGGALAGHPSWKHHWKTDKDSVENCILQILAWSVANRKRGTGLPGAGHCSGGEA